MQGKFQNITKDVIKTRHGKYIYVWNIEKFTSPIHPTRGRNNRFTGMSYEQTDI
jgi:hypothetical protein